MAGEDKHSKKHPASDAKKRQLKKKGQVAKSQDVPMAVGLLAAFGTLMALRGFYLKRFGVDGSSGLMYTYYQHLEDIKYGNIDIAALLFMAIKDIAMLSLPVLFMVMLAGVGSHLAQSGLILSAEPLIPKMSKINPMSKLKQWFSIKSLQELFKSLVKILAAGYIGWIAWHGALGAINDSVGMSALQLMGLGARVIQSLFTKILMLYITIAFVDFMFQKKNYATEHKMTDKEVRDEYKQQEGDPYMKAKRRQMAQQISMQQSQEHVPQGDVVVINPTELAICLKYDPELSPVPYVIAKGETRHADDIRASARKHGVPIVRNKPLARALFELCEIGDIVPSDLFRPVAEVLAYVFALKEQGDASDAAQSAAATVAAQQPVAAQQAASTPGAMSSTGDSIHELGNIAVPAVTLPAAGATGAGVSHTAAGAPFTWMPTAPATGDSGATWWPESHPEGTVVHADGSPRRP